MRETSGHCDTARANHDAGRRRFLVDSIRSIGLLGASGAIGSSFLSPSFAQTPTGAPVVSTTYGKIRGLSTEGISAFKGVHYGANTAGPNRFLPPKRPAPWDGVKNAFSFGDSCPQLNNYLPCYQDGRPQSEDCLVINVWTPAAGDNMANLPVMLWFHGGAFENESASEWIFDGHNLAKTGNIVLVTLNHRLNFFGYSYLAGSGGKEYASSGNVGQLDLVAAMQWVQENIRNFGGNPGNVTIFGESGGGGKVSTIMGMPAARGLFHKAIVQSGSFLTAAKPREATQVADMLYDLTGVKRGDLSALQALSTDRMRDAYIQFSKRNAPPGERLQLRLGPVVDGMVVPRDPWAPAAPSNVADIPMIIGITGEEAAFFVDEQALRASYASDRDIAQAASRGAILSDVAPEKLEGLVKLYRREMPHLDGAKLVVRIGTDVGMWRNAVKQAELKVAKGGTPTFMYEIDWAFPMSGQPWSMHGIDLPMVFGNIDMPQCYDDQDSRERRADFDPEGKRYVVTRQTMKAWTAFAHEGNPSTPDLKWPAYDLKDRATMILDGASKMVNDPRSEIRKSIMKA